MNRAAPRRPVSRPSGPPEDVGEAGEGRSGEDGDDGSPPVERDGEGDTMAGAGGGGIRPHRPAAGWGAGRGGGIRPHLARGGMGSKRRRDGAQATCGIGKRGQRRAPGEGTEEVRRRGREDRRRGQEDPGLGVFVTCVCGV